jgi:uncharacterized protein YggE
MKLILVATAAILSMPAWGQIPTARPFVTATGRGTVSATPDQVKIQASVTTEGPNAAEATSKNATIMTGLLEALRKLLGTNADIKTVNFNVYPVQRSAPNQAPAITGYTATNSVEVTLTGTSMVGSVIDVATASGATSIGALQFSLKDPDPVRLQALRLATQQAKSHADAIAAGVGRTAGNIISIQESAPEVIPVNRVATAAISTTPFLPGPIEIQATVVLQAELN